MAGGAIAALTAAASPAMAAEAAATGAAASPPSTQLEAVVVTATRREENIQRVPVAVTAITGATLQAQQQTDVSALARSVPNLNISVFSGDPTNASIELRGQVNVDNTPNVDPAVGLYLDGVYVGRSSGANLGLIDVERVEVLRGPQGTLFGRNTIGGAINVVPTRPNHNLGGWLEGSYGNFNAWTLTGVLNVPITDILSARLVVNHQAHNGFAHSSITGAPLNSQDQTYIRGAIRAQGSDWDVLLAADYTHFQNTGQWVSAHFLNATGLAFIRSVSGGADSGLSYPAGEFSTSVPSTTTGPFNTAEYGGSLTISKTFGSFGTFKSISAWRGAYRNNNNNDLDGTPYLLLQQQDPGDHFGQHQFSQEFQLYGKAFEDKLDWIIGAYYFRENGYLKTQAIFDFAPGVINPITHALWNVFGVNQGNTTDGHDIINHSKSVFGQATWHFTDQFSLTLGVRPVWDTRNMTLAPLRRNAFTYAPVACNITGATLAFGCQVMAPTAKFQYTPFMASLNFQVDPKALVYVKFSRGFRAGGFNFRATNAFALQPFQPERVDSEEVGAKVDVTSWLRVNAAAYHSDFTSIQFSAVVLSGTGTTTSVFQNAGSGRINGVELEGTAQLGNLRLNANFGALNAHYNNILPTVTTVTLQSPFQQVPNVTWGISGDYKIPTAVGPITLHADYYHKSRIAWAAAPPASIFTVQPGYGLANAQVNLHLDARKLDLTVWVRNLADQKYALRYLDQSPIGFISSFPGDPRTYGFTARYAF